MLKEIWFPVTLTIVGLIPAGLALAGDGNARRLWLTAMGLLWFIAWLSYVWGDPVRGPFATMTHPGSSDTLAIYAGGKVNFPIKQLSSGIDFTHAIRIPGEPIHLFIQKTWWSGWNCDLDMVFQGEPPIVLMKHNKVSGQLPAGWDINFDDHAIEVVDHEGAPILQVIQDRDYDVYVNTVTSNGPNGVAIMKGSKVGFKRKDSLSPQDLPKVLFKYPSEPNRGVRQ